MSDSPSSETKLEMLRTKAVLNMHAERECSIRADHLYALIECAEALQITRGQWIHSVNAEKCLAALDKLEAL